MQCMKVSLLSICSKESFVVQAIAYLEQLVRLAVTFFFQKSRYLEMYSRRQRSWWCSEGEGGSDKSSSGGEEGGSTRELNRASIVPVVIVLIILDHCFLVTVLLDSIVPFGESGGSLRINKWFFRKIQPATGFSNIIEFRISCRCSFALPLEKIINVIFVLAFSPEIGSFNSIVNLSIKVSRSARLRNFT